QADHHGVLGVFSRPMMPKAGFLEVPFSPDALCDERLGRLHPSRLKPLLPESGPALHSVSRDPA
ncbi:hypothetical protein LL974_06625, partial [Xanthomonas campestris pv. cannae]|nr:hypothetical protein [Xanthomonas campestris pv. cannae]